MIQSIFTTVALMLVYMIFGFVLCKVGKAKVSHAKSLSALLIYVFSPAMLVNSFLNLEYSQENLINIGKCFGITLFVQLLFFMILYCILHKKYKDAKYRILTVGAVLGNVGFMGMPVIESVFPGNPIVLCYSSINVMTMNLIVFTLGVFMITNNRKFISIKNAFLNPTSLSIFFALPVFLFRWNLPEVVTGAIGALAKAVTPMCMIILGMRLSEAKIKEVFTRPFVYFTCILKLVVFPLFAFILVRWMPFADDVLKTTVIVLAMTPSGAVIESMAELHECEQGLAANVVLLTTILSVATIPIMTFLLIR